MQCRFLQTDDLSRYSVLYNLEAFYSSQLVLHYQYMSDIPGSQMPPTGSRAKTSS